MKLLRIMEEAVCELESVEPVAEKVVPPEPRESRCVIGECASPTEQAYGLERRQHGSASICLEGDAE